MNPKASIVILTRGDRPDHLRVQLDSCLAQRGVDIQVIVSTVAGDPSIPIAEVSGARVVIDTTPGPSSPSQMYRQWNLALKAVTGDWMAGCSGNDATLQDKMASGIHTCLEASARICDSAFYVADEHLNVTDITDLNHYYPYQFKVHASGTSFVSDACVVHRSVWNRYGPIREDLGNIGLYDFWLRIGKEHPGWFVYNRTPQWIYRLSPNSRHMRKHRDAALKNRDLSDKKRMLRLHS